jgi:molybdopterin-guanine dinucleotide biosynthesis protein B
MRIIGLAGWSGSGKTTLMARLLPVLVGRGARVSTLKHAHHSFELDHPGKDSFVHRDSGATEVLVSSSKRFALMRELRGEPELSLEALIRRMSPVDYVIIEGFKRERHPKIEVFRAANGKPPLHPDDPMVRAIATDAVFPGIDLPQVALDDAEGVANLVINLAQPPALVFG